MDRRIIATLAAVAGMALGLAPAAGGAGPEQVPGQVIVKFRGDATGAEKAAALDVAGVRGLLSSVDGVGAEVVDLRGRRGGVAAAIAALERSPAVEYAEPNYIYRTVATPNDPRFAELWGLNNLGQTGGTVDADIDAPEGWDLLGLASFPPGGGAKVGIVDTGVQLDHPEFAGGRVSDCAGVNSFGINLLIIFLFADPTIVAGKCADDNGHGTHVAGTLAANANNSTGVAGVAFNSPLAICKALDARGAGTLEMVANCIAWVNERGAKVISMSLGGSADSETLRAAVQNATANGSLLIAAAGNGGNSSLSYPAAYPEVVSVAATDHNDARASFSQFNDDVELAAPGVDVLSTWNDGGYRTASGTSMATPHASAVAALIAAGDPTGGPAAWRAELDAAVDDLGAPGRDPEYGFGRVNISKTIP